MEAIAELLPLLFVAAYYLLGARRKAVQKKAERQRQTAPNRELISDEPRKPSPFQSFLTQLEEAMAEANGVAPPSKKEPKGGILDQDVLPDPEPSPTVPPSRPIVRPRVSLGTEFKPVAGSFDSETPSAHDRHGFGPENPLSEETFERLGGSAARSAQRSEYDPHGLRRRRTPVQQSSLFGRLHDPKTARDAFVLQTIFGRRGGRRSDQR